MKFYETLILYIHIIIVSFNLKRLPAQPREARHISTKFNVPQTLAPIPYETLI